VKPLLFLLLVPLLHLLFPLLLLLLLLILHLLLFHLLLLGHRWHPIIWRATCAMP